MAAKKSINKRLSAGRIILAGFMIFLLLFLTTANYFVNLGVDPDAGIALTSSPEEEADSFPGSPTGPDEKPPSAPVSISEEYIHGHIENSDFFLIDRLFTHLIGESEKIELVHFELLSPPPEC
jgi:hypothetical protein